MKTLLAGLLCGMVGIQLAGAAEEISKPAAPVAVEAQAPIQVYPAAILPFQERGAGVKEMGAKVSDMLFAYLVANPDLFLVDRADLDKTLAEAELNLSGVVSPDQANQVGKLTGAKILITGSVIDSDKTLFLVAKIIGTETTRVLGASVQGKSSDDIAPLVQELANKVSDTISKRAGELVAKTVKIEDRLALLKAKLGDAKRPTVSVHVQERHVGQATIDPASQTELILFLKSCGFEVLDSNDTGLKKADILIEGEGFSEFATRRGGLVSVKSRLEIKAKDRMTEKIIAVDRQTAVMVDLTEQIAGKNALQSAAAQIAERLLPQLVK